MTTKHVINLNSQCEVVLNKDGAEILNEYFKTIKQKPPKVYKSGDYFKDYLWIIMNIFGRHFGWCIGPIETEIRIFEGD